MPEGSALPRPIDEATMIGRARELAVSLLTRRLQALADRRVSDATIADMVSAGMFKVLQPKKFGGLELPYGAQVGVSAALAHGCGASSWLCSVVATHHWMLGKFDPQAQDEVWGTDPDSIVCSAFGFSEAKVDAVDGGYRATGRWTFSSGSHAAGWAMIGIPVESKGGPPGRKFALVPRTDFVVLDNWRSVGLRGSGSNDITLTNAFIPAHRTIGFDEIDRIDSPGTRVNTGATYRLPTFNVFNLTGVGPTLGLARAALESFTTGMKQRRSVFGSKVPELQNIQIRTSESSAEIDAAELIAENHVRTLQSLADSGQAPDRAYLLKLQRDCAYIGRICQSAVTRLVEASGAGGLDETNVVQLNQADMKGVSAHLTMGWDANCVPYGKFLLGVDHQGLI
jgi:3-hydroxy-9,10-secoandrosta-1,3,5(10)-triene-9,17-dione monooxygenase